MSSTNVSNIGWLTAESIVSKVILLAVTSILATYMGAQAYGVLAYTIAVANILFALGHLGLDGILTRELINADVAGKNTLLGTTFALKIMGGLAGVCFALILIFVGPAKDPLERSFMFWMIPLLLLFPLKSVLTNFYHSRVQGVYIASASFSLTITSLLITLTIVYFELSINWAATVRVVANFVSVIVLIYIYVGLLRFEFANWRFSKGEAIKLFADSWMIYLGSLFAIINLKIDVVMLKWLDSAASSGIYAIATVIWESTFILPSALVITTFPMLVRAYRKSEFIRFHEELQEGFDILATLGVLGIVFFIIFAKPMVGVLFGDEFVDSGSVLVILSFVGPFIYMRLVFSKWIIIVDKQKYSLYTQFFGAVSNVLANLALIPIYGMKGAAYATLISYFCSSILLLFFFKETKFLAFMMVRSIFQPWKGMKLLWRLRY